MDDAKEIINRSHKYDIFNFVRDVIDNENKMDTNSKEYIFQSMTSINDSLRKKDHRKAFWLLMMFFERLTEKEKMNVIKYYMNAFYDLHDF